MRRYRELLQLSVEQKAELSRWAQSRTLAAGDVFRAHLILALADGWSYSQIKERLTDYRADHFALETEVRARGNGRPNNSVEQNHRASNGA